MSHRYTFFATCPKAMEDLLAQELKSFGADHVKETRAGVSFAGNLEAAYRACLWSRIANRILLPIKTFPAQTPEELYEGVCSITWSDHLSVTGTLAVDFTSSQSRIVHTQYGALKVKDAIVDQFRSRMGQRPSVDVSYPDIRVNVYVLRDEATVSIDLSGESQHRRGYREQGVSASLKENLAAAILYRVRWPETAAAGGALVDPMCGSGTLPIEAALMAADSAPGLGRKYFGFSGWHGHRQDIWNKLVTEAQERRARGLPHIPPIAGYDSDSRAVRIALANVERAGLRGKVHVEKRDLSAASPPRNTASTQGLVVVNPPYGERLGDVEELLPLYKCFGKVLLEQFSGWNATVLTGNVDLAKAIGLRAVRVNTLYNGALECRLVTFKVDPARVFRAVQYEKDAAPDNNTVRVPGRSEKLSEGADMFANRLRKNLRQLRGWAQREGIYCYRVYDADIPEYAVAVDLYERWVYVQEYEPPKTIDREKARARLGDVRAVVPEVLGVDSDHLFFRVRRRQKGGSQYRKENAAGCFQEVHEDRFTFLVNFTDYLDTGLFLDHRRTRSLIRDLAGGRRFLNLFAYAGTATVYAAGGGATATTSVDSSNTYLSWARKNLALNGFGESRHEYIRADCMEWLRHEKRRYGLIFIDPPTFSNSKQRDDVFDLQRDYVELVRLAAQRLDSDGILMYSNNYRRFKMNTETLRPLNIEDITAATIAKDFARNPRIHKCWKITKK